MGAEFKSLFESRLNEEYPDKIVNLSDIEKPLLKQIKAYCDFESLEYKNEIIKLGFYIRRKGAILECEIITLMTELFPEKKLQGLEVIKQKNSKLNNYINKYAKERGMNRKKYLEEMGFIIVKNSRSKYDFLALRTLRDNYNLNMSEHASLFGIKRQAFSKQEIDRARGEIRKGKVDLKDFYVKKIIHMIESYQNKYIDECGVCIHTFKHNTEEKIAIFIKNKSEYHYIFNPPSKIELKSQEFGYNTLDNKDFLKIKNIMVLMSNHEVQGEAICLEYNEYKSIEDVARKLKISRQTLLERLGFNQTVKYIDKRVKSKEEILSKVSKFVIEDGRTVSLPAHNNEAQSIRQYASRKNMSTEEYVKSLGFLYKRRANELQENREALISEIKSKYVVKGNQIYISSYDRLYKNMTARAYKQGKTLDKFLNDLGFKRLTLEQLPSSYQAYDWIKNIEEYESKEDYIREIKTSFLYKGYVYIPSNHYFYDKLFYYSLTQRKTINEQLEEWGFTRTYQKPFNYLLGAEETEISPIKLKLLNEIKDIQTQLKIKTYQNESVNRSRLLVKKLKELYNYTCQACESDNNSILMESGHYYIEVHHINPIHKAKESENEENLDFDHYQNLICLCPFHHKYVHYHKGGNYKLNRENLKLTNHKGEELKIVVDFHLR